ncbi:MAG: hypothetical protein MK081_13850 [Flavobacteriales bacterium]|nr:hypothetical protein [Flavobacteriales bacterium]
MKSRIPFLALFMACLASFLFASCVKSTDTSDPIVTSVVNAEKSFTADSVDFYLSKEAEGDCYTFSDLGTFLQFYSKDYSEAQEIIPCFNNFHQDIGVGGTQIGNVSVLNGARLDLEPEAVQNLFYYTWQWSSDGNTFETVAEGFNPSMSEFDLPCDGGGYLKLSIYDPVKDALYSRTEPAWLSYNDENIEQCEGPIDLFDAVTVITTTPPEDYTSFQYLHFPSEFDHNQDMKITVSDLRDFLPRVC